MMIRWWWWRKESSNKKVAPPLNCIVNCCYFCCNGHGCTTISQGKLTLLYHHTTNGYAKFPKHYQLFGLDVSVYPFPYDAHPGFFLHHKNRISGQPLCAMLSWFFWVMTALKAVFCLWLKHKLNFDEQLSGYKEVCFPLNTPWEKACLMIIIIACKAFMI